MYVDSQNLVAWQQTTFWPRRTKKRLSNVRTIIGPYLYSAYPYHAWILMDIPEYEPDEVSPALGGDYDDDRPRKVGSIAAHLPSRRLQVEIILQLGSQQNKRLTYMSITH
jgi:hypothetical protein